MRWWIMLATMFAVVVGLLQLFRTDVAQFNHFNHASRLVSQLCAAVFAEKVSVETLCRTAVPEIPEFKQRYQALLSQDREWFQQHGWKFYPSVDCSGREPVFNFMDRDFVCRDDRADMIRDRESELAADAAAGWCFKEEPEKRIRTVATVAEDGTIVLENKERVILAGVTFPGAGASGAASASCGESVGYVKSQLAGQSVYVHAQEGAERDEQYRLPVYLLTFRGEFFNREIVRLGLAKATKPAEGEKSKCFEEFQELERNARTKKLGLWGTECLR